MGDTNTPQQTGYGPRSSRTPLFDGDERKYELWEIKFLGSMRIKGLHTVFSNLDNDAVDIDPEANEQAFAELVQTLDDRSLSLIIREAKDDGRKALKILQKHYLPKGKPRIITLYTELTSLTKSTSETVTDYIIRAESYASSLRDAKEVISDSLLVAMVIKGLPSSFESFTTVITQKEAAISFSDFKVSIRNFEDTQKIQSTSNSVMSLHEKSKPKYKRWCSICKSETHDTNFCRNKNKRRWCENCKSNTHDTSYCRSAPSSGKNPKYCSICKSNTHTLQTCRKRNGHAKTVVFKEQEDNISESNSFAFTLSDTDTCRKAADNPNSDSLLIDSGASIHILTKHDNFKHFNKEFKTENHVIELANGVKVNGLARGQGEAVITLHDSGGEPHDITLSNALFIPTFNQNILSVPALTFNGATVNFKGNSGTIQFKEHKNTDFKISKSKNLYYVNSVKTDQRTLEEWHKTLGHCNFKDIIDLEKSVDGMKITNSTETECETCILGKMIQTVSRKSDDRAKQPFDIVNIDLAGPIDPIADGGDFKYALICVDHYTNLICTYLLKQKSDAGKAFKIYLSDIAPYGKIKCVRSDQGGEFLSAEFESILTENKIKHEKTAPYSPHQNGKAERGWRTLFSMARCLLIDANLPKNMWSYALKTAAYIRNRCLNKNIGKTPFEAVTKKRPNIKNMHIFGQTCYAFVNNPKKLDNRSRKGIFVGYDRDSPSYLVYFPEIGQVKKIRDVKFSSQTFSTDSNSNQANIPLVNDSDSEEDVSFNDHKSNNEQQNTDLDNLNETEHNTDLKRTRKKPKHLSDYYVDNEVDEHLNVTLHYVYGVNLDLPTTYNEAMNSNDSDEWRKAMNNEIKALEDNDTFELVSAPQDRNIVGGRWVYVIKTGLHENKEYKARYVAKGFSQTPDIDYSETFSPTARMTSIRLLMQLSVQMKLKVHQMDVKSAYLNAPIDKEIFVEQPQGYAINGKNNETLVWKLKKSLYGLKQSGRNWNETLNLHLSKLEFKQSTNDPCIYSKRSVIDDSFVYLLTNVDDLLIFAKSESELNQIKSKLNEWFKMKDLGEVKYYLGIEFNVFHDTITMSQSKYIDQLLQTFGMKDCKARYTPCEMNSNKLNTYTDPLDQNDTKTYRQIVGGLIYLMSCTRPDLSFVVTMLSQFMSKPTSGHMIIAKHVLRYLKGTMHFKLTFSYSEDISIDGYCDSDWASSDDRKSITGYCFQLSTQGPLISWKSRKQPTIALSTCEAEYMSLVSAIQEGKYLVSLVSEITESVLEFKLKCDNQGAIAIAKNPVKHQRTKHISIKYHFIRDEISKGNVEVTYIPSEFNIADLFTKPTSSIKLKKFFNQLMGF